MTTITYDSQVIASLEPGKTATLECANRSMKTDVVVTFPNGYLIPGGTKTITENGTHNVKEFESVDVDVPNVIPDGYIVPSGTTTVTTNGTYNVREFEQVKVDVPSSGGDCTRPHVIETDTLPTEGIDENAVYFCDDKYYKYGAEFNDLIVVFGSSPTSYKELIESFGGTINFYIIPAKTTDGIIPSTDTDLHVYYIKDEDDVFTYQNDAWSAMSDDGSMTYGGTIDDISEATEAGYYYILGGTGWKIFANASGSLSITENGTYNIEDKSSVKVNVPSLIVADTLEELPTDAPFGSTALVFGDVVSANNDTSRFKPKPLLTTLEVEYPSGTYPNIGKFMPYWNSDWINNYFNGDNVWTDGTNIYYSYYEDQYKLNKDTRTWEPMTWNGFNSFYGDYVWTDGTNIYYSYNNDQYKLIPGTYTWESVTWTGVYLNQGNLIWKYKDDFYFSSESGTQFKLIKNTTTWEEFSWNGTNNIGGCYIWTYNGEIYHTKYNTTHKLNTSTDTWEEFPEYTTSVSRFFGSQMWTDGIDLYNNDYSNRLKLNKTTNTWEECPQMSYQNFEGGEVWTDGKYIYCAHEILVPTTAKLYWSDGEGTWYEVGHLANNNT